MKKITDLLIVTALLFCCLLNPLFAQDTSCVEDFENELPTTLMNSVGNWGTLAGSVAFEVDATTNGTMVLHGNDGSGSSWMTNITDYSGNWIEQDRCELCFDIRYVAGPNNPAYGFNAITIFQNPASNPTNLDPAIAGGFQSRFITTDSIGPEWVNVCIPIALSENGTLPSNSYGQWQGTLTPADFDNLIQNVSGIAFRLDFVGGSNPAEDLYVDNLCFQSCPPDCATILDEEINCDASGQSYTFNVQNNSGYTVDGIIVNQVYDPTVNIPNGGVYGPTTVNIPPGASTYCFEVIMFSENLACCHYEHCIELPPCDPCDSIEVVANRMLDGEGDCCYEIDVINNFDDTYFTKIVSTVITPGVNFEYPVANNGWAVNVDASNKLTWTPGLPYIDDIYDAGALGFCLTDILHVSQMPQQIQFDWVITDSTGMDVVVCSDTLIFDCETCLMVENDTIYCLPNGDYQYCLTVYNNDNTNTATEIYFDVYEPNGIQFNPFSVPANLPPVSSAYVCVTIPGTVPSNTDVLYRTILKNFDGDTLNWCCIVDTFSVITPECDLMTDCPFVEGISNLDCIGDIDGDGVDDYSFVLHTIGDGTVDLFSNCATLIPNSVFATGPVDAFTIQVISNGACNNFDLNTIAYDLNQNFCAENVFNQEWPPCLTNLCLCDNLAADVALGFTAVFDCPAGVYTPIGLSSCDNVLWLLNGIPIGNSTGNQPFAFNYQGPGDYNAIMFVSRVDNAGAVCTSQANQFIVIDEWCPIFGQGNNNDKLEIAPNPANNHIAISIPNPPGGELLLQVLDPNGEVVKQRIVPSAETIQMDIADLQAGIYFLAVSGSKGYQEGRRFVKAHVK